MHSKNAVFGAGKDTRVVSGSCNWSGAAMGSEYAPTAVNHEDTLWVQHDEDLALNFTSNFLAVLRSYEAQQDVDLAELPSLRRSRVDACGRAGMALSGRRRPV